MRLHLSGALAAAVLLFATAGPAQALTLAPPDGTYTGASAHHGAISFHLDVHKRQVTNFRIRGHVYLHQAHFTFDRHHYGSFNTSQNGMHFWGHWSAERYGHVSGGYSYTYHGHRYTTHWWAKAPGF